MKKILLLTMLLTISLGYGGGKPNLQKMSEAGRIIHSEDPKHGTHDGWIKMTSLMNEVKLWDNLVNRMMATLCADEPNKSVLLVGEPSDTYRYLWARLSQMAPEDGCQRLSHFDMNIQKLQGYMYVGTTERAWRDYIEQPAYDKDVVVYFDNLARLIGIGTSSNKSVGIESTYVGAIKNGQLKSVAFINKYDYNRLIRSRHAYVLNSFQETIQIEDVQTPMMDSLIRKYLELNAPHIELTEKTARFLYRTIMYYQPNQREPQRTMGIIFNLIKDNPPRVKITKSSIATPKPYKGNMDKIWNVSQPGSKFIQLRFSYFNTESNRDKLRIFDGNTDTLLDTLSGSNVSLLTKVYKTNNLKLHFTSSSYTHYDGFKVKEVWGHDGKKLVLNFEDVRQSIMKVVQVPAWIMNRDYKAVRDFPKKLEDDVVGVAEGKKAVIKQIKVGYVSGRTDEKPAGSLLFVGPTGTGKSYIAKKAAEFMGMQLITLDMTQYGTPETFDRFLDSVADSLVLYPFAFYLFEEIDKADRRVLDRLYFMMDEGVFYDKSQRPLFARGALIMMTTNAGYDVIIKNKDSKDLKAKVNAALQKKYRPSFLNRFDAMPIFVPFNDAEYLKLATIMTNKKIAAMKEFFDWDVTVDKESIKFMGKNGQSKLYGARPMERMVENVISVGISEFQIMKSTIQYGAKIAITKSSKLNHFNIAVNGGQAFEYEVDVDLNNSGLTIYGAKNQKLLDAFFSSRMYLKDPRKAQKEDKQRLYFMAE